MPSSQNGAFGAGVNHLTAPGRDNSLSSITLSGDQGLDGTSARWNQLTPHSVLASATAPGLDFAGVQRMAGNYQPGSMGKFTDELSGGADSASSGEE